MKVTQKLRQEEISNLGRDPDPVAAAPVIESLDLLTMNDIPRKKRVDWAAAAILATNRYYIRPNVK